ncbi:hypothetical protein [Streptomyces sp. NPDC052701]|uniref:hypothetical protein n=1 Tax=Streptomyces sp. NPDC052701 TaxID=3155533 RepID=UPI00343D1D93
MGRVKRGGGEEQDGVVDLFDDSVREDRRQVLALPGGEGCAGLPAVGRRGRVAADVGEAGAGRNAGLRRIPRRAKPRRPVGR